MTGKEKTAYRPCPMIHSLSRDLVGTPEIPASQSIHRGADDPSGQPSTSAAFLLLFVAKTHKALGPAAVT